jgi:hypothetical protein
MMIFILETESKSYEADKWEHHSLDDGEAVGDAVVRPTNEAKKTRPDARNAA